MQRFVAYDGTEHPVRDGFNIWPEGWSEAEEVRVLERWRGAEPKWYGPKPTLEHQTLRGDGFTQYTKRWRDWVMGVALTKRDRLLLDAWTNRNNINKALAFMGEHDYRRFGFTTVCQIHGNRHTRPCGCDFHCVFDHHERHRLTDAHIKPLRALFVCQAHRGNGDLDTQFWASARDSAQAA